MRRESGLVETFTVTIIILLIGAISLMVVVGVMTHLTNKPFLISYATSKSMEPTIKYGDLFIIIPKELCKIEQGDIIVFNSEEGILVHRIVGYRDGGYLTKGDANPFIDQERISPVKDDQIIGKVLMLGGKPLLVPRLGIFITKLLANIQVYRVWLGAGLGIAGISLIVYDAKRGEKKRERAVTRLKIRDIFIISAIFLLTLSTAFMLMSRAEHEIIYVTSSTGGEFAKAPGEEFEQVMEVKNRGLIPIIVFTTMDGKMSTLNSEPPLIIAPLETRTLHIMLRAESGIGVHREKLTMRWYPLLLPPFIIEKLYYINELCPIAMINALLLSPLIALYAFHYRSIRFIIIGGNRRWMR